MQRSKWIGIGVALGAAAWAVQHVRCRTWPAAARAQPPADEPLERQARRTASAADADELAAWEAESSRMRDA